MLQNVATGTLNVMVDTIAGTYDSEMPAVTVATQSPALDESDDDMVILKGSVPAIVYAVRNPVNLVDGLLYKDTSTVNTRVGSESHDAVAAFQVKVL